ncbi:MAG: MbtH domain protein [Candidatus Solibacter sp.]
MDELVQRLSERDQPVEVTIRPDRTGARMKECLDRGYVHIKFTETKGGTELGVRIDANASDVTQADFDAPAGNIRIVGDLKLNYVPVRCIARIDLATFQGLGHLEIIAQEAHAGGEK